jgi:Fe-S cluster biogenesis protein NfuA
MEPVKNRIPVTVYAEETPNPNSMKFVASYYLLPEGIAEYTSIEETEGSSPLAKELFGFPYIKNVFITANFVSVIKTNDVEWFEVTQELRTFIKEFLANGGESIIKLPTPKKVETAAPALSANDAEVVAKIMGALDEFVRPAVEQDGGAITFRSFENGTVNVILQGSCSGCPSSTVTLKNGIENLLTRMIPEVKEVVAIGE